MTLLHVLLACLLLRCLVCLLLFLLPATVARSACSTLGHMGTFLWCPALAASLLLLNFKDDKIKRGRGLQHQKQKWKKCTLSVFTFFTTTFVLVAGAQQGEEKHATSASSKELQRCI